MKRIGFLATGSEIITGEILNKDSQLMAQQLLSKGMNIGEHLVVDDIEENLTAGLKFLFSRHDVVITTGGLGPTADDRTRDIIAKFIGQKLIFRQSSWDWIVDRFEAYNIPITENNKQQAYFPEKAVVLQNKNGSADGCRVEHESKTIFMLPGPPAECLPMFEKTVLPYLKQHGFGSNVKQYRWRLMGVSESVIALELDDKIAKYYGIEVAYRASFPYTDIKISLDDNQDNHEIVNKVSDIVAPYFITDEPLNISQILQRELKNYIHQPLHIDDQATKGKLQDALLSPATTQLLHFKKLPAHVTITGLTTYWQNSGDVTTQINMICHINNNKTEFETTIPIRGEQTVNWAVEFCCAKLLGVLQS